VHLKPEVNELCSPRIQLVSNTNVIKIIILYMEFKYYYIMGKQINVSNIGINEKVNFYLVYCLDPNEQFVKVGITSREVNARLSEIRSNWTTKILFTKHLPYIEAFKMEQSFIEEFREKHYKPSRKFSGWTECFSPEVLDSITKDYFE
jgi:hypothetical protein